MTIEHAVWLTALVSLVGAFTALRVKELQGLVRELMRDQKYLGAQLRELQRARPVCSCIASSVHAHGCPAIVVNDTPYRR